MKRILLYIAIVLSISISLFNGCMSEGDKIDYYISDTTLSIWSIKFNAQISQYVGNDTIIIGVDSFPNWAIKVNSYIKTAYTVQNDTIIYGVDDFEAWRTKFNTAVDSNFNNDAELLFARMSTQPTADEKQIYSNTFDRLQANSIDDSLDAFWTTGVHTQQSANLNWFNSNFTLTNNGATWMPYFGYTGNGSTAYVNTNYNPSIDGVKYIQTSAVFGIGLDSLDVGGAYFGASDGANHTFVIPQLGGLCYGRMNTSNNVSQANTDINNIFVTNRTNNTSNELYVSKLRTGGSVVLESPPNLNMYLLARNSGGSPLNYSSNNINSAFIGGALLESQVDSLVDIINDFNTEMRALSPIAWGVSPSFPASINSNNLQANLDGGNVTKTINTGDTIGLDTTIYIESYTTLTATNNTVIEKQGSNYSNVFLNRGALNNTIDSNIAFNGIDLSVNGNELTWEHIYGGRAQFQFLGVKDLTIQDFYCQDGGSLQFMIYMGNWENVLLQDIYIESQKDGIDLLGGTNATIRNYTAKTNDDGIFIGGNGFPAAQLEYVSSVSDVEIINYRYIDSSKVLGARGVFMYVNSWVDWTNGLTYQTGDYTLNGSRIYQVNNSAGFSAVGANAPTHSSGVVVGADGISWHFLQDGDFYTTNISNISIDSSLMYDPFAAILAPRSDAADNRTIYPGTEDSASISGISITNTTISNTRVIDSQIDMDVTLTDNIYDSLGFYIRSFVGVGTDSLYIVSDGNDFNNCNDFFSSINDKRLFIDSDNETYTNSTFINNPTGTGEIRAINYTLPFADLADITPVLNDTCRNLTGLNYWDGTIWQTIP